MTSVLRRGSLSALLAMLCCLALTAFGRPAMALEGPLDPMATSGTKTPAAAALASADPADIAAVSAEVSRIVSSPAYQRVAEQASQVLTLAAEADISTAVANLKTTSPLVDPRDHLYATWDALRPGGSADVAPLTAASSLWHTLVGSADMAEVREDMLAVISSAQSRALFDRSGRAALLLFPGEGLIDAITGVVSEIAGAFADAVVAGGKFVAFGILFFGAAAATATALVGCAAFPFPTNVPCFAAVASEGIPLVIKQGDKATAALLELARKLQQRFGRAVDGLVFYVFVKTALAQYCVAFTQLYAENPDALHQQAMMDSCNRAAEY